MRSKAFAAGLIGLLLATTLFRSALLRVAPDNPSSLARQLSPRHPSVVTAEAMRQVGEAAAAGSELPASAWSNLRYLASEKPLAIEPLLVSAALAERAGRNDEAATLLDAARSREPRSAAVRYLLADLYLRAGKIGAGLTEMAELSKVVPGSSVQIIPALAQFAKGPGAADQLRRLFAQNPQLEDPVLTILASDPANADLILSAASQNRSVDAAPWWQTKLLNAMVAGGDYSGAYRTWQHVAGVAAQEPAGIFNPEFRAVPAPPPFNWKYESTRAGIAQPESGNLRILFYGRQDALLASETLLLPGGKYRLRVPVTVASGPTGAVAWTVTCLPSKTIVLQLPIPGAGTSQTLEGDFNVGAQDCLAQRLSLIGRAQDAPQTADLQVWPIDLGRIGN
jgi:hypothetical protein